MPLHPQAEAFIHRMVEERVPQYSELTPTEARMWEMKIVMMLNSRKEEVGKVENLQIDMGRKIPIRVYTPITKSRAPPIVYFHGGGWVVGNLDQVDLPCRLLANGTQHVVISVDYRLAPEHKFPAAPEDCYAAAKWVSENSVRFGAISREDKQIIVCGDSAGGNLASIVSMMAHDHHEPTITTQVLVYPVTDLGYEYRNFPDELSPALTQRDLQWFINHYVKEATDAQNELASPLLRANPYGLPPTIIITAEYDILTQQCNAYANKLKNVGVQVKIEHFKGLVHGFFTLPDMFDAASDVIHVLSNELP